MRPRIRAAVVPVLLCLIIAANPDPFRAGERLLFSIIQAAGWPIWPLIACSVIALALIIERFLSLKSDKVAPPRLLDEAVAVSRQHVLRGIHGDDKTWKLISCLQGSFYMVVINNDPQSKQYRKWTSFTLSESNRLQVLVPPKFGNGHVVMSEQAIFHYKQTTDYDRSGQFTLVWNDPALNIWWPVPNPIVSERDQGR